MTIIIGIDPHKATHTAVAIDSDERVLDKFTLRASKTQGAQLRAWAEQLDDPAWTIESARGLGYLLSQQLIAAGETVGANLRVANQIVSGRDRLESHAT